MNESTTSAERPKQEFDPATITRPADSLLMYYVIVSLCTLIGFPFVFLPLYIRFKTMRYRFDDTGVSMCWGFFFRHEVHLTYRRLQDIHVTRNILERWMGLAKVPIQTASGAHGATMTIEGVLDPESLRDFLYSQMRGAQHVNEAADEATNGDSVLQVLEEIRDEIGRIRSVRIGDET